MNVWPLALALALAFAPPSKAAAPPPPASPTIKGFNAPITEGNRTVARVSGVEARPSLLAGEVQITGFRLETYRYSPAGVRETELIVESAAGTFGTAGAGSDRALTLRSADDRFSIAGDGWGWNRTTALLVISNRVVTTLRRPGTGTGTGTGTATNHHPIEVRSRRFEYNLRTGDARFIDDCSALEPGRARLVAGELAARLAPSTERPDTITATRGVTLELLRPGREGRATGTTAVYSQSPDGERIELEGHPTWKFGPGEGSADHLILLPAKDAYAARGNARLRLLRPAATAPLAAAPPAPAPPPGAIPAPAPAPPTPIDITAATIEGGPKEVVFTGPVVASQGDRLELRAARVVVSLDASPPPPAGPRPGGESPPAAPRPTRIEATGTVSARIRTPSAPLELHGERMLYTPGEADAVELIEVSGQPRWVGATHRGSAERFIIRPGQPSFEAIERVQVTWQSTGTEPRDPVDPNPAQAPAPGQLPVRSPAADPIELTAARMTVDPVLARFTGGVHARRESWDVTSAELDFGLATNSTPRSFTARGGVLLDYLMPAPVPGSTHILPGTVDPLLDNAAPEARRWRIRAAEVEAGLSPVRAGLETLDATGAVRIDHPEVHATGSRLAYRATDGLLRLTGDARLDTRAGLVIVGEPGTALIFDPRNSRFSVEGRWRRLALPTQALRGRSRTNNPVPPPVPLPGPVPIRP